MAKQPKMPTAYQRQTGERKRTNFDIENYVHLTYSGVLADTNILGSKKQSNIRSKVIAMGDSLDREFAAQFGMDSMEFYKAMESEGKVYTKLAEVNSLFEATDLGELLSKTNPKELEQFGIIAEEAEAFSAIARINGFSTVGAAFKIQAPRVDFATGYRPPDKMLDALKVLEKDSSYEDFLKVAGDGKYMTGNLQNRKNTFNQLSTYLLYQGFEEAELLYDKGKDSFVFKKDFHFQNNGLDKIKEMKQKLVNILNDKDADPKDVDRVVRGLRNDFNKSFKGEAGEYSTGVLAESFILPVYDKIRHEVGMGIEKSISHTGPFSKQEVYSPSGYSAKDFTVKRASGGKKLNFVEVDSGGLKNFSEAMAKSLDLKNQKADLVIQYPGTTTMKLSTKMRSRGSVYNARNGIEHYNQSLGAAIHMAESLLNEPILDGGVRTTQVLNALNLYYLGYKTTLVKKDGKASPRFYASGGLSIDKVDALFDGILSDVQLAVAGAALIPETASFVDINGMIIPAPLYYKITMRNLTETSGVKTKLYNIVHLNQKAGQSSLKGALQGNITAEKTSNGSKGGMNFAHVALQRNAIVRKSVLGQRVSFRGTFMSSSEFAGFVKK